MKFIVKTLLTIFLNARIKFLEDTGINVNLKSYYVFNIRDLERRILTFFVEIHSFNNRNHSTELVVSIDDREWNGTIFSSLVESKSDYLNAELKRWSINILEHT